MFQFAWNIIETEIDIYRRFVSYEIDIMSFRNHKNKNKILIINYKVKQITKLLLAHWDENLVMQQNLCVFIGSIEYAFLYDYDKICVFLCDQ